jgi:hypothetical protein
MSQYRPNDAMSGQLLNVGLGRIATRGVLTAPILLALRLLVCSAVVQPAVEGQSPPAVTLNPPSPGASQLSGNAYNVNTSEIKVVIYALTNEWYVQPYADEPFTSISPDGSWSSFTNPWSSLVVLLVNPANYTPAATEITNPGLDPGVLAWTEYPSGPVSVNFSGRTWGIKVTGDVPTDPFDPGPNFWSNDPSVVSVAPDGLHLKITQINGMWQCGEVYLLGSLGHGTYTVQVGSPLNDLDLNTVAAPLFIYEAPGQELDNEYSGMGGLIASPDNAQFVVQPYTVPGNLMPSVQPSTSQFTSQMEWAVNYVTFLAWNGWSGTPAPADIIYQWTYTGAYIPPVGQDRVHINLWLLNGSAPVSGTGDGMVINSFNFLAAPVADFNGDGHPDLLWQNDSTRQATVWYMGGTGGAAMQSWSWISAAGEPGWHVAAVADFNGDGVPDLVWQNDSTRQVTVWYMGGDGGAEVQSWNWISQEGVPGWHVAAVADFNGDGVPDLVWQNDSTRQVTVWYMGGTGGAVMQSWSWISATGEPGWHVAVAADFNGDGVPDLVWQNDSTRQVTVWYMGWPGGSAVQSWNWISQEDVPGWHVAAVADFNLDGVPDLVWQNDGTRQATVWYMGGTGGAVRQSWSWIASAGVPGWSVLN